MKNGGLSLWNSIPICENLNTPHERRFGEPFVGPVIPFGSMVEYHPVSAKDQSRLRQFGKKVLPGTYLGRIWTGYIFVADIEELGKFRPVRNPCSETQWSPHAEKWSKLHIPGDQVFRRSTSFQEQRARGEEHEDDLWGESDGCQQVDTLTEGSEARNDFRTIAGNDTYRHHVEPRVEHDVPNEESCPIPLEYVDVVKGTNSTLDVFLERRIDDYCNVDDCRDLSEPWTNLFHNIEWKTFRRIHVVRWAVDKHASDDKNSSSVARDLVRNVKNSSTKGEQPWAVEKSKRDNARKLRGIYFIDPVQEHHEKSEKQVGVAHGTSHAL